MFRQIILLFIVAMVFFDLHAQYTIDGGIVDEQLRPISYAHVSLFKSDSIIKGVISDNNGYFIFKEVKLGEYNLKISHLNYTESIKPLKVSDNTHLDSIFLFSKSLLLEGVVIKKYKKFLNADIDKLNYKIPDIVSNASTSIYQVLQHIPNINSNIFDRTIEVNGRSNLYLEVNGIHRNMDYLVNIDPKDVLEIEIVENPTGKYLSKDVSAVINIVTKNKERGYSGLIGSRQSTSLTNGLTYGTLQYTTPKISFNLGGQNFFFNEDNHISNRVINRKIQTSNHKVIKQSNKYPFNYLGNNINVGVDYKFSDKSILLIEYKNERNDYSLNNTLEGFYYEDDVLVDKSISEREDESNTNNNTYILHYQYKKDNSRLTVNLDFNEFETKYLNNYTESFLNSLYVNNQSFDNKKIVTNLFVDYEFTLDRVGRIGFGTRFNNQKIKLKSSYNVKEHNNSFIIIENRNVSYLTISNIKISKILLQLGIDIDYSQIEVDYDTQNDYIFILPNFTFLYKPNKRNSFNFNYRLSRNAPTIESLNPHERYTDSLKVYSGNPYLEPYYYNTIRFKYNYSKGSFFISPEIGYSITNNYVATVGHTDPNGVYHIAYANVADYTMLFLNLQLGMNILKWWRIKGGLWLERSSYLDEKINRTILTYGFQCQNSFFYKKLSANISILKKTKELNSNLEYVNPIESSIYAQWKINKWLSVNGGIRYFIPWKEEFNIDDINYTEHYQKEIQERNNLVFVGINFFFQNGRQSEKRDRKKYDTGEDAQMRERR